MTEEVNLRADYFPSRPADGGMKTSTLRIFTAAIALAATVQFLLFGYFVVGTEIRSPISDSFAYIDDYLQFRAGKVSLLEYLWQSHGEHHLVLPPLSRLRRHSQSLQLPS
jgi:hypothetical protein